MERIARPRHWALNRAWRGIRRMTFTPNAEQAIQSDKL